MGRTHRTMAEKMRRSRRTRSTMRARAKTSIGHARTVKKPGRGAIGRTLEMGRVGGMGRTGRLGRMGRMRKTGSEERAGSVQNENRAAAAVVAGAEIRRPRKR